MLTLKCVWGLPCATFQLKQQDQFDEWVARLRHHRLYRQNEIASYEKTFHYPHHQCPNSPGMSDSASIRKVWAYTTGLTYGWWCLLWESRCRQVGRCMSLLLQGMSIRRQSTVHAAAAFPQPCSSQVKVAAWLQSSEDMDKCSKGEGPDLSCDLWLPWDSALCDALLC